MLESLFKACVCYFLSICCLFFLHQMMEKLWKMFFISSKSSFRTRDIQFFSSFPHFLDSKGQVEVE